MRNSDSDSVKVALINDDVYGLLWTYSRESKVYGKAYSMSESYYRRTYKIFNYPLVILSAVSTICSGLNIHQYIMLGIALSMMILIGFDKLINPKEKEHDANRFAVEYQEIASNIKQFIMSNNRSKAEVKAYSETVYALISKWKSINPPLKDSFVKQATVDITTKLRSHRMKIPKQWEDIQKK